MVTVNLYMKRQSYKTSIQVLNLVFFFNSDPLSKIKAECKSQTEVCLRNNYFEPPEKQLFFLCLSTALKIKMQYARCYYWNPIKSTFTLVKLQINEITSVLQRIALKVNTSFPPANRSQNDSFFKVLSLLIVLIFHSPNQYSIYCLMSWSTGQCLIYASCYL